MNLFVNKKENKAEFKEGLSSPQEKSVSKEQSVQVDLKASSEVSDFMGGLDVQKPSEYVSEGVSEDDKKQQGAKGQKSDDQGQAGSFSAIKPLVIPTQNIMVRQIRRELQKEINVLLQQVKIEEKKGPYYLNQLMEKIRELKSTLSSLATATYEVIKNLYVSFFEKKKEITERI